MQGREGEGRGGGRGGREEGRKEGIPALPGPFTYPAHLHPHSPDSALSINIIKSYVVFQRGHSLSKVLGFTYATVFPG